MTHSFCGNSSFWDSDYTLNGSWPRFTQCFQSTALVYAPAGFLWLSSLFYIPYLVYRESSTRTCNTPLSVTKTSLSLLLAVGSLAAMIVETVKPLASPSSSPQPPSDEDVFELMTPAHLVSRIIPVLSYILTAILVQLEKRACVVTSGVLFIYWLLQVMCLTVPLYTYVLFQERARHLDVCEICGPELFLPIANIHRLATVFRTEIFGFTWSVIKFSIVIAQFVVTCFSDVHVHTCNRYIPLNECPEVTASFLSRLLFSWITRLMIIGYKRPLVSDDLWSLNPRDTSEKAIGRFSWAWRFYNKRRGIRRQSSWMLASGRASNINSDGTIVPHENGLANGYAGNYLPHDRTPLFSSTNHHSSSQEEENYPQQPVNRRSKCSLFRVLVKGFGWEVFLSYLCKLAADFLQLAGPFLLKSLIIHTESKESQPIWHGYVLAAAMLISSWCQSVFYHQHYHLAMTSGLRMKSALLTAIYKKALCLDTSAQRSSPTGEIVNLMSLDCQRVQDLFSYTWMYWSIPLQVFLAVYLLWDTIGPPILSGLVLLLLLVPFNAVIGYFQQRLQRENLSWKDRRIKVMSEVLSGIKFLKLYAWEESFQKRILSLRDKEVTILTKLAWLNAFSICIWTCVPFMVCLVSFATFVLAYPDTALTAEMAFVTLALFNILQFPISFIPELVSFTTQASVSLKRIGRFLCETELDRSHYHRRDIHDIAVNVDKGIFTWNPDSNFRLSGVNLEIPRGCFVAVVGPVGCGKSSLVSAILGEMDSLQGSVDISGSTAYVPQTSWIQNATLRDNILFGYSYNQKRYRKIIEVCALVPDLEILPAGDQTEIGEKGLNLSGGQKQRVSIARALYANSDIYIVDDPLSAVDSHVGKHIFKRVLSDKGLLKNKTRIMTTNAVHWLPLVDLIVVMQDGRITEVGSYLELMKRVGHFSQFLFAHLKKAQESESEIETDEEVRQMKMKMWEHVESVTSQSEGNTSSEDLINFHQNRLNAMANANLVLPKAAAREETPAGSHNVVRLTEDEITETETVRLDVLGSYLRNIGCFSVIAAFLMFALYQASNVLASVWLSKWTGDPDLQSANFTQNMQKQKHYIIVYGALGAAQVIFIFIYACVAALRMVSAASGMHTAMLDRVLKAPMSFFETNPLGRVVNRFSRDVDILDNQLPQIVFMWVTCVFSVAATLLVISINTPIFTTVIVPLFLAYLAMQRFFVPTTRQLKRLESVTRSPIYSHFSETLSGCHVIRAFDSVARFVQTSTDLIDKNQVFYFAGITANRWLGIWVEAIGSLVVFFSAVFSLMTPGINGAVIGLSVSYALQITQALKWLVRTMSDIETNVVSVERVKEYSQLVQEAARHTVVRPPSDWPCQGQIIFKQYSTRYREGLDPVLRGLDCVIQPGEKIGIVGRTGAGKSSLTLALFRLLEASEGEIIIDNIPISALGLYDLRSKITILPQDPVIFSGTLRDNLDPDLEHLDQEIWTALTMSNMKHYVSALPTGLYSEVGENGLSLSTGQRQLLCLTRALLRRTKILVLDEPTSSVDVETDTLVQAMVRRVFRNCTTITVAHRINTILDCSRVMVLESGSIIEFDNPQNLLQQEGSHFYNLAKSDGVI